MKIVFFEIQTWEKEMLQQKFPNALLVEESLTAQTAKSENYKDAEIVSTFINSGVSKDLLDQLPNLRLITTRSTGYDHIDTVAAKAKGIVVANVPEYGSNTVAEHTFALILSLTRKIYQSVNQSKKLNFNHDQLRGVDLFGKTIGIIGLGKIGLNVLRIANGFGMKALVYNRTKIEELHKSYEFEYMELEKLLENSDIVSLHLPLLETTKHIINKSNILKFKKDSYLVNTARGGLIETEAIIQGLDKGILAGVGLDVLEEEKELGEEAVILTSEYQKKVDLKTLVYDHLLINHPKVLITPHNAFNSKEALERITQTTIENIENYLANSPKNIIV